ncbi:heparanase-like protein 3 [Durio zibethinus]|uniref:Heparanase-like protein 3 n=1 Tax=Durio zibethinus TaxID=66656 RepID=A0A6P5ZG29_DURZI|nr:heparanase-like protein 3 [Durio zibethinus]
MSFLFKLLFLYFWLYWMNLSSIFVTSKSRGGPGNVISGTVFVNGTASIGKTDENFICATVDWWPPDKCDYGTCSWGKASLLNLDLSNPILLNAIKAFSPLKIRMGGTLQDKVIYETKGDKNPCTPFIKNSSEMFGFSKGCLPMSRWDELNIFFKKAGAMVVFGLNALNGRSVGPDGSAMGAWNFSNAESLIRYTVNQGYTIHGWELGNELCGSGIGAKVAADQYAFDVINLQNIVQNIYKGFEVQPLIIAPGGFFDANWFTQFVQKTPKSLQVVTQHIYNLGAGNDNQLMNKILNPSYLDGGQQTFRGLQTILKNSATSAVAWVGEAGGAYNSGQNLVSNSFVYSFWYLDQLGMASSYDTKTYCRQSLIGGNYGLLDTTTFVPRPDYYSALLWHRLMGSNVLSTRFSGTTSVRAYAHCSKQSQGITLLLINLNATTTVQVRVSTESSGSHGRLNLQQEQEVPRINFTSMSRNFKPNGNSREEYHLTAKDGDLHSQNVVLNGKILILTSSGGIPSLEPVNMSMLDPIIVAPFSIVFSHIPNIKLPACK